MRMGTSFRNRARQGEAGPRQRFTLQELRAAARLLAEIADGGKPSTTTTMGAWVGASFDPSKAVRSNRSYAQSLGWQTRIREIQTLLSLSPSSTEEAFATAVADFQQRQRLVADGILGPNTWRRLEPLLGPPRGLTATDVRDDRIDVFAQRALLRLAQNPTTTDDAREMLSAVKGQTLAGIYKEDQRVPALRAQRMGAWWGTLIPPGTDAASVPDPANAATGLPIIVFRDQVRSAASRLDPALVEVWRELKLQADLARAAQVIDGDNPLETATVAIGAAGGECERTNACSFYTKNMTAPPATRTGLEVTEIRIDLSTQRMTLRYSDGSVESVDVSTGRGRCGTKGNPCATQPSLNCTPTGTFTIDCITTKGPDHKNSLGQSMPYFVAFCAPRAIGIHRGEVVLKKNRDGSKQAVPASHGCVRVQSLALAKRIWERVTSKTKVFVTGTAQAIPRKCG